MRFEFWHADHDSITWSFNRAPRIGEEVILGESVFEVTGERAAMPGGDPAFDCVFVRTLSSNEIVAHLAGDQHWLA